MMKQRKRGNQPNEGQNNSNHSSPTQAFSSASNLSSSASAHARPSSASIPGGTKIQGAVNNGGAANDRGKMKAKSDKASFGIEKSSSHSKAMLLELLLTVPRLSLIILTPLVVGMILRVAPSMLDPVYGSVFSQDRFLENSFVSMGAGIVFAVVYTLVVGAKSVSAASIKGSTEASSSTTTTKSNQQQALAAGLWKDKCVRTGIVVALDLCALVLACSFTTTSALFAFSGDFGPRRGPHLTQLVFAYPVLALLGFANTLACVPYSSERNVYGRAWMSCVLIQVGTIFGLTLVVFQMTQSQGPNCPRIYTASILAIAISTLHKLLIFKHGEVALPDERLKGKKQQEQGLSKTATLVTGIIPLVLVLALAAQNATRNPQCQSGVTKAHNPVNGNFTILARNESVTGWVSVVDELVPRNDLHIRFLRAGHSLIGGMYAETGDSIFGVFYMPEAVRLIKNRNKSKQEVALQIGLGVGIVSGTFTDQGMLVDVVDIDPVVIDYASKYFDWPKPHGVYIQDGRQFIRDAPANHYDYVIHDVFTGGGVPPSLFSLEALHDIDRILKPDGVLALNMVASEHPQKSQALHSVRKTLHAAFKHVVAFKENPDDPDGYQNVVFFAAHFPIKFDRYEPPAPLSQEELARLQREQGGHSGHSSRPSIMRDWILTSFEDWPLSTPYDPSKGELILDRNNTLNAMQFIGAEDHWHAMRSLFPVDFWLNY
ncbi:hypothetical protein BGW38_008540 [Lunasporangiospora selenospora]|uniref:PABS domain-containing protein n=1 Tax=Lunasporangiospora selenospora TaxID=979761 RepID=A0A9P6G011_9FUNG|nr:hypothetical protein BGW38_008540 [Lunasporangiospora selenospora]